MKRADVLRILAEHQEELERLGVLSLAVFGSVARDEAGPDSDVDLLVEFVPDAHLGLFKYVDIQQHLEQLLGRPVDLVMKTAIKRLLKEQILGEAVPAVPAR